MNGGFSNAATEFDDLPNKQGLAAGDFNRDNNLDIAIVTLNGKPPNNSHVTILLGDGTGGFRTGAEFGVNNLPSSVAAGDLNKDGILDLVVAGALPENTTGTFISTYLGDGTGKFGLKNTIALGQGSLKGEIALGDFNEDGILDVAYPQTSVRTNHGTKVLIFFGDATGSLLAGPILAVGRQPHTVVSADFNKDGHLDLAVSNSTDGTISILLGDGTGNFTMSSTTSVVSPIP